MLECRGFMIAGRVGLRKRLSSPEGPLQKMTTHAQGASTRGSAQLILVRHGESAATEGKQFGSWMDAKLTPKGVESARRCAALLRGEGLDQIDVTYTSLLSRTIKTAWVLLEELDQLYVPVKPKWRLNERHYGNMTGQVKREMIERYGQEKVQQWRRSLDVPPPPMEKDHFLYDEIHASRRFKDMPSIPTSESLADVRVRLAPFIEGDLLRDVKAGKRVLICGHSNSLRALITIIEGVHKVDLGKLNLPYGFPIVYDMDSRLKPLAPMRVLGDTAAVAAAVKAVCHHADLRAEGQQDKQGGDSSSGRRKGHQAGGMKAA